jgi:hypothetical protein
VIHLPNDPAPVNKPSRTIYDGLEEGLLSLTCFRRCPKCRVVVAFQPAHLRMNCKPLRNLTQQALGTLGVSVTHHADGTIRFGKGELAVSTLQMTCSGCGAELRLLASLCEVQPARYVFRDYQFLPLSEFDGNA